MLKDVYEALRAGPRWNDTLLWVGYDDAGGFYDHVVPPSEGVPAPDHPCHIAPVCNSSPPALQTQQNPCLRPPCTNASGTTNYSLTAKFDFRRLGLRSAAMLISPWIPAGPVFQAPKSGPSKTSQFEHSSIPATVKKLFGLSQTLTKRTEWAGTFDELLTLDAPRIDAPMHLPNAPSSGRPPPPAQPAGPPWCGDGKGDLHCRVFLRRNLCNDTTSNDFGGGSATYRTVEACMDWCVNTSSCHFFALSPTSKDPWCIRYEKCIPRTSKVDATYTVYEVISRSDNSRFGRKLQSKHTGKQRGAMGAPSQAAPGTHCGRNEAKCAATAGRPSSKQRNQIPILSALTLTPIPDMDSMDRIEAAQWIASRWREWNEHFGVSGYGR